MDQPGVPVSRIARDHVNKAQLQLKAALKLLKNEKDVTTANDDVIQLLTTASRTITTVLRNHLRG